MPKSSLISIKAAIGVFAMISFKRGANYAHIRDYVPGPHYTRKKDCRALPPSNNCIVMLDQIARDGRGSKRADMIYYDAALI
jgi:hypothetical protein